MNRKNMLVLKIVLLALLLIIVCAFAWRMLTGGWGRMNFNFDSGEMVASEAYSDADAITALDVDVESSAVEVQTHDEDSVRVEIYRSGFSTKPDPKISRDGDTVRVTQSRGIGLNFGGGRVLIYVPEQSVLDYSLITVSGSVRLEAVNQTAVLKTVSGSIRAMRGGDTVQARTVSGSIRIFEPYRTVNCETTSGSIRARANGVTEQVSLSTVSGSTRLSLTDDITGYTLEHSSVSGSVKDEYRSLDYSKNGTNVWGGESLKISMKTTSGIIRLEDWTD